MSVTTTSTPSKVTLPPLSSILYTPSKDVSSLHLLSNTSLVSASTPNTTFNDSTLHKFNTSRTFSFTSSPILKKSISFPLVGLPAPIQFPSLNANISQSRYTLTNSTPSSSLSAFPSSNNAILQLQQACKTSTTSATTAAPPATATATATATASTLTTTIEQPLAESSFIHSTPLVKRTKSVPLPSTTATATATIKPKFKIQPLFKIPIVAHPTPIEGTNTATTNVQNSRKRSRSDSSTSSTSNTASSFAFISHSQQTFLSNEPDIDNARLARRKRRRTSPLELSILQDEFLKGITPNKKRREEIASRVDMTEKAVQIWFQNRRQALRKAAPGSSSTRRASTNDCNNNGKMVFIKYDAKGNSIDEESRYEYSTSDDSNDSNDTDATDNDDNKENINSAYTKNEQTNAQSLRGLQASNSFRNPLRDITDAANNVISSANANANVISTSNLKARTQKFKHTHFGLVERNGVPQRRQKPTMKVKVQNGNASNGENFFYGSQGLIIKD